MNTRIDNEVGKQASLGIFTTDQYCNEYLWLPVDDLHTVVDAYDPALKFIAAMC